MKTKIIVFFLSFFLTFSVKAQSNGNSPSPPFNNIAFDHRFSELIRSSDTTAFKAITYKGQHNRKIENDVINRTYIFTVDFEDGLTIEMQVNSKFGSSENAKIEAEKLAIAIGSIPTILRLHLKRVVVSKGNDYVFSTGKGSIFISNGDSKNI